MFVFMMFAQSCYIEHIATSAKLRTRVKAETELNTSFLARAPLHLQENYRTNKRHETKTFIHKHF